MPSLHRILLPILALAYAALPLSAKPKPDEAAPTREEKQARKNAAREELKNAKFDENGMNLETGAIDTSAFRDSAQHWYSKDNPDRVITANRDQQTYKPTQVREIAANILLFQRANGIWPKNYDYTAILTPEQRAAVAATRDRDDTTIDNHNTHSQIVYLARACTLLRDDAFRAACERAFDTIITAQLPCGGFPQIWPDPKSFHAFITYNDGVTIGMLNLMRDIAGKRPGFEWFDDARRKKARAAVAKGIDCILATQYTNKQGVLQAWGQQHDPKTMKPGQARKYEFPALCTTDTAAILAFLMETPDPDARIIRAVKAGAAWLETVKQTGIRFEEYETTDPKTGKTRDDKRIVLDPAAGPIWARLHELETNRPIFGGRDGIVRYNIAEIDHDRRNGYGWYSGSPRSILENTYPAWLKKNNPPK